MSHPGDAAWLERQAKVLEMAARVDPAAVHAAVMAAQARQMAALVAEADDGVFDRRRVAAGTGRRGGAGRGGVGGGLVNPPFAWQAAL